MVKKGNNVFDYLDWRGDLSFQKSSFNEVDALILSILSYLDFSCITGEHIVFYKDAINYINQLPPDVKYNGPGTIMSSVVELANKVVLSKRFCDMGVFKYVNIIDEEKEMQFAAVTFFLSDKTIFLSFRGTDNTLVGWKEDLNMCCADKIPAQIEAARYAELIAEMTESPLRLGGHSKGGNLSIWAGAHLPQEYKKRILGIYSNDGPGFSGGFIESALYKSIQNKKYAFVPESSIVGVLMEHDQYTTIRSSNPSLLQHDPFSWQILGARFVYDNSRTASGKQFERVINAWIKAMSRQEREELIDNIYDIVSSSNAKTLDDFDKNKIQSLLSMQKTFREMGLKKQTQLIVSLSKVIFNSDMFSNNNLSVLLENKKKEEE